MLTMYPAVFIPEPDGRYSVLLPDFDCATCGDDLTDALEMAVDCMAGKCIRCRRSIKHFPNRPK